MQALCNGTGHRSTKLALGLNKQNETVYLTKSDWKFCKKSEKWLRKPTAQEER